MAKVLLANLKTAIAETIGQIYAGVVSARDTGIAWARSPEKVDFQVEVVMGLNALDREQVVSAAATTRTQSEGEQITVQVQEAAETVVAESSSTSSSRSARTSQSSSRSASNSQSSSQSSSRSASNSQSSSQSSSRSASNSQSNSRSTSRSASSSTSRSASRSASSSTSRSASRSASSSASSSQSGSASSSNRYGDGDGSTSLCWVARAAWGEENPRWLDYRETMLLHAPIWFVAAYWRFGPAIARHVNTPLRKSITRFILEILEKMWRKQS